MNSKEEFEGFWAFLGSESKSYTGLITAAKAGAFCFERLLRIQNYKEFRVAVAYENTTSCEAIALLSSVFQSEDEAGCSSVDEESYKTLKQQEEVFRNLDAQYEMARSQTHTQRGMGLGFTSSMRGMDAVWVQTTLKFGTLEGSCSNVGSLFTKKLAF